MTYDGYQGKGLYCEQLVDERPLMFSKESVVVLSDFSRSHMNATLIVWNGTGEPLLLLCPVKAGIRQPYSWNTKIKYLEGKGETEFKKGKESMTRWDGAYYKWLPSVDKAFLDPPYRTIKAKEAICYRFNIPVAFAPFDTDYVDLDITVYFEGFRLRNTKSGNPAFRGELRRKVRFKYNPNKASDESPEN